MSITYKDYLIHQEEQRKKREAEHAADKNYELRKKLFYAMRNDLGVMAEHNDDELSLFAELKHATEDILAEYSRIFLEG